RDLIVTGVQTCALPILAVLSERFAAAHTRVELNRLELDVNNRGLARIASVVARAPEGGVLVHCHAGKDRTGIVVALLLSLVGVRSEERRVGREWRSGQV